MLHVVRTPHRWRTVIVMVRAKCTFKAWDSTNCVYFNPGDEADIDPYGQLASLRTGRGFVFEFDRTMKGTGMQPALGGYVCKGCSLAFDTLNDLGTHEHQTKCKQSKVQMTVDVDPEPEDDPPPPPKPVNCKPCNLQFADRGELLKHKREVHGFKPAVKKTETEPVPA